MALNSNPSIENTLTLTTEITHQYHQGRGVARASQPPSCHTCLNVFPGTSHSSAQRKTGNPYRRNNDRLNCSLHAKKLKRFQADSHSRSGPASMSKKERRARSTAGPSGSTTSIPQHSQPRPDFLQRTPVDIPEDNQQRIAHFRDRGQGMRMRNFQPPGRRRTRVGALERRPTLVQRVGGQGRWIWWIRRSLVRQFRPPERSHFSCTWWTKMSPVRHFQPPGRRRTRVGARERRSGMVQRGGGQGNCRTRGSLIVEWRLSRCVPTVAELWYWRWPISDSVEGEDKPCSNWATSPSIKSATSLQNPRPDHYLFISHLCRRLPQAHSSLHRKILVHSKHLFVTTLGCKCDTSASDHSSLLSCSRNPH